MLNIRHIRCDNGGGGNVISLPGCLAFNESVVTFEKLFDSVNMNCFALDLKPSRDPLFP
jgi:hypothetical protein